MDSKKQFRNIFIFTFLFLLITMGIGLYAFLFHWRNMERQSMDEKYEKYYAMIVDDKDSFFWQSVYEGAKEQGGEHNVLVELLGDNLSKDYSKEELMQIAIASKVDGIILEANESKELTELIDEAAGKGISVVTIYSDNTHSKRCSFVGVGGYNLGQEYGRQVLKCAKIGEVTHVAVLVNTDSRDATQNIIYSGMQDTVEKEKAKGVKMDFSLITVDNTNAFSVEESIRDLFMSGELPDVIVCLDEANTACVYQELVDHNKVGEVAILGYYKSDTILQGIDRNVINATLAIETGQMGRYCVDALWEYGQSGNTSQYFTVDVELINKDNVAQYMVNAHEE